MRRDTKIVAAFVGAVPLMILSASTLCSYAIANGASTRWRMLFRVVCHQIPARCIELFGTPMPICARCTAIYAGLFLGLVAFFFLPPIRERVVRIALLIAVLPLAIDGTTQLIGLRESTNELRIVTGILAGIVFGIWILEAVERPENPVVTIP
jgi:uncharacterized membrane protein